MTCVVGAVLEDGRAVICADDLFVDADGGRTIAKRPKVWHENGLLFGYCGDVRFGQIVQNVFKPPRKTLDITLESYMTDLLIPKLSHRLRFEKAERNGSSLMVASREGVFVVEADDACMHYDYAAIGSGAAYALGFLYGRMLSPRMVEAAIWAAAHHNCYVGKPTQPIIV